MDRSRKQKKYIPLTVVRSPTDDYSYFQSAGMGMYEISTSPPMRCDDLPLTPPLTANLAQTYALPKMQDASQYGSSFDFGGNQNLDDGLHMLDFDFYTSTSPTLDRKTKIEMDRGADIEQSSTD